MKQKNQTNRRISIVKILVLIFLLVWFAGLFSVKTINSGSRQVNPYKAQLANFKQALDAYYLENNMYPHTIQGLEALVSKPTVGVIPKNYRAEGYLGKKEVPKDAWNNPYHYKCEDYQNYELWSLGKDGQTGTGDDINVE